MFLVFIFIIHFIFYLFFLSLLSFLWIYFLKSFFIYYYQMVFIDLESLFFLQILQLCVSYFIMVFLFHLSFFLFFLFFLIFPFFLLANNSDVNRHLVFTHLPNLLLVKERRFFGKESSPFVDLRFMSILCMGLSQTRCLQSTAKKSFVRQ